MDLGSDLDLPMPTVWENGYGFISYTCPWTSWVSPKFRDIVKWLMDEPKLPKLCSQSLEEQLPILKPNFQQQQNTSEKEEEEGGIRVTWLGHSTLFLKMEGLNILTDPMFGVQATTQFPFGGPLLRLPCMHRYRPPPCKVKDLHRVDVVLISHNHHDHLDIKSVMMLNEKFPNITWLVPLGMKQWMLSVGCTHVYELNWWESYEILSPATTLLSPVKFYFTPAQHWSGRGLGDTNTSLWGSFSVIGSKNRFFFAGDTGYCEVFKKIGEVFGPFDLAAIPIGAYNPRWFMHPQHVDPSEAVQMHSDLKAKRSIGIHWGTFRLTNEHYMEPKLLLEALTQDWEKGTFFTLNHGESAIV